MSSGLRSTKAKAAWATTTMPHAPTAMTNHGNPPPASTQMTNRKTLMAAQTMRSIQNHWRRAMRTASRSRRAAFPNSSMLCSFFEDRCDIAARARERRVDALGLLGAEVHAPGQAQLEAVEQPAQGDARAPRVGAAGDVPPARLRVAAVELGGALPR